MSEETAVPRIGTVDSADYPVTVLLIDDQPMIAEAVRRMLAPEADIRFHYCEDPTKAVEKAIEVRPTVILQDLVMPQIDGLTLLRFFRTLKRTRRIPMIMLSTKEDPKVKAEALGLGASDYLVKLPDRIELLARIRHHSQGYISGLQRDHAYGQLEESQRQLEVRNRFIRDAFGRYLSDEIVSSLLETPEGLKLGGEKRKVTIMFADLRGFTATSESLPPEKVVSVVNNFLGVMTDVLMEYNGTIDEFLGDAILAIFGAPIRRSDDTERAVACAIAMQLAMTDVNEHNRADGLPEVEMGIGLNTGEVVVGNIGSQRRAKYGVVGKNVNLASRVESYTIGGQILIPESTRVEIPDLRVLSEMQVEPKGVKAPITLYEVGGIGGTYDLQLVTATIDLVALAEDVAVRYTILSGKHATDDSHIAFLEKLSEREAEVCGEGVPEPLTNVKLRLVGADGNEHPSDIYAKVLARRVEGQGRFAIRFTSVPADVGDEIKRLLAGDKAFP